MFAFDWDRGVVDPSNGDHLKTTFAHHHSRYSTLAIFSASGIKKFEFTIKSHSVDDPPTRPADKVSRLTLLGAREFEPDGRSKPVYETHPDIERLVEYERASAMGKIGFVAFEFVDERKNKR